MRQGTIVFSWNFRGRKGDWGIQWFKSSRCIRLGWFGILWHRWDYNTTVKCWKQIGNEENAHYFEKTV
jgi:hypothetical protein